MKIVIALYLACIFPTIAVFESVHEEFHKDQWPKLFTFLKVWFTMPFFILTKLYNHFKNK